MYADYAGCPPCPKNLLKDCFQDLYQGVDGYRNPHSDEPVSFQATKQSSSRGMMDALRQATLQYCNACDEEYDCIITHGATSAMQLVADCFPWGDEGEFYYLQDNHTSAVGIQGSMAFKRSSKRSDHVTCVPVEEFRRWYSMKDETSIYDDRDGEHVKTGNLFVFPMESNFSGSRYSLDIVKKIQDGCVGLSAAQKRFRVLVDAAKSSSSFPPDLSKYKPDFVAMSYYKIFGYPTGLGALVVRKDAMSEMEPGYFGGGTVDFLLPERDMIVFRDGVQKFENGTPSFLSIPAAVTGFRWVQKMNRIPHTIDHVALDVALHLAHALSNLCHANGLPVCNLYGQWPSIVKKKITVHDLCSIQGPTVTFNVFDQHGRAYGSRDIVKSARLHGIYMRSGSLCNAGALRHSLRIDADEMATWRDLGYSCNGSVSTLHGSPTGAIRASFGYASTRQDAVSIFNFIRENFYESHPSPCEDSATTRVRVERIFLYPIKACRPQEVDSWNLDAYGLQYDRNWKIIDATSRATLTAKSCPGLCKMTPRINPSRDVLTITWDGSLHDCVTVPAGNESDQNDAYRKANEWISEKLNKPCSLVHVTPTNNGNFSNQSNVLVMYRPTIHYIRSISRIQEDVTSFALRMRPNLIFSPVSGKESPFDDDAWSTLLCTDTQLKGQHVQPCKRCETICIDTTRGTCIDTMEPLKSIIRAKRGFSRDRRFSLGSLFEFNPSTIQVGTTCIVEYMNYTDV